MADCKATSSAVAQPEQELFPELVCPVEGEALIGSDDRLVCARGHGWDVDNGIPRMVSRSNYADAFGLQWNTFVMTQLDSHSGLPISRDRLEACLGPELWRRLHEERPLAVLETGCGAGRFTENLLETPAVYLTSCDLSDAVDANRRNTPLSERHRIVQSDILQPPFLPEAFDLVLCLGVVQHTPDPKQTIAALYGQVRPGGWLVFDHYTHSLVRYTKLSTALRYYMKHMEPEAGLELCRRFMRFWFPLHRAVRNHRLLQNLLSRVSPLITYFHQYPKLSDQLQEEWALLDTHDSLTDYYKHLRSRRWIRATMEGLGAEAIFAEKGSTGVIGRCRKPT